MADDHALTQNHIDPSKELRLMLAFFGESELPRCVEVAAEQIPNPYLGLLVHYKHMTVTLEEYHKCKVNVHPYQVHRQGDVYARKLDLEAESTGLIVMTGIMMFNFSFCNEHVRDLIISQKIPLGRILIENNIMRTVSPRSYVKIDASDPLISRFRLAEPHFAYGRLATIFCDGKPAVDLLEVVRPE